MEKQNVTIKGVSKDVAKQTFKAIICFLGIILLFFIFNIVFILITNSKGTFSLGGSLQYIVILIEILVGIVFLIMAILFTKKYVLINTLSMGYGYLTPFFRKFNDVVASKVYNKGLDLSKTKHITKAIDVSSILRDSYTQKVPRIVQRGINLLLDQIPFSRFFQNIQKEMKREGDSFSEELVSNKLYEQTDNYIQNKVFDGNNLYWIFWLFPLNVVVQFILYLYMVIVI